MAHLVYPNNITIGYSEMDGSPKEGVGVKSQDAVRTLKCAWADRLTLAAQLVGYTQPIGLDVIHFLPHQYPHSGLLHLFASDIRIERLASKMNNTITTLASYTDAILTVTYSVPDYEFPTENEETYVTESLEPATEFMTISHKGLYWDENGEDPIDPTEAPAKLVRMTAWVYTLHSLYELPSAIFTLPGKVNTNDTYSWSLNKWFAYETLLCGDPSLSREKTSTGVSAWAVTFRFIHRNAGSYSSPLGWNEFPRPKDSDVDGHVRYTTVKTLDGHDVLVYELSDFEDLII
jgi:hypothetical protein